MSSDSLDNTLMIENVDFPRVGLRGRAATMNSFELLHSDGLPLDYLPPPVILAEKL
jgi:hypothetical protein